MYQAIRSRKDIPPLDLSKDSKGIALRSGIAQMFEDDSPIKSEKKSSKVLKRKKSADKRRDRYLI